MTEAQDRQPSDPNEVVLVKSALAKKFFNENVGDVFKWSQRKLFKALFVSTYVNNVGLEQDEKLHEKLYKTYDAQISQVTVRDGVYKSDDQKSIKEREMNLNRLASFTEMALNDGLMIMKQDDTQQSKTLTDRLKDILRF